MKIALSAAVQVKSPKAKASIGKAMMGYLKEDYEMYDSIPVATYVNPDLLVLDDKTDDDPSFTLALMITSPEFSVKDCCDFAAKHGLEIRRSENG
jgi:hypothetical protein